MWSRLNKKSLESALARMLVLHFSWPPDTPNEKLAKAQAQAEHLCAVGHAWLSWLECDDGRKMAEHHTNGFTDARTAWAETMRDAYEGNANMLRVASNLATNAITWDILCQHPTIGPVVRDYTEFHSQGLETIATGMARCTATALEAVRFLDVLRELFVSGRALLLSPTDHPTTESERSRHLGWTNDDGSAFILPKLARAAVDAVLGVRGLGDLSEQTLHGQLDAIGAIESKKDGRFTTVQWISGEKASRRVIHLSANAMKGQLDASTAGAHD